MNITDLTRGDTFQYNERTYRIKDRDDTFTYCVRIPSDGYGHWLYNTIIVDPALPEETFKRNPDHKNQMYK